MEGQFHKDPDLHKTEATAKANVTCKMKVPSHLKYI